MVQVASLGLGKSSHGAKPQEVVNYFEFSPEVAVVSLIAVFLAIFSCAGYFICHCCPFILPEKVQNIRGHIYRSRGKPKKFLPRQQFSDEQELFSVNFSSNSKSNTIRGKQIPDIVISTVNDQLTTHSSDTEFTEIPLEEGKPEEIT